MRLLQQFKAFIIMNNGQKDNKFSLIYQLYNRLNELIKGKKYLIILAILVSSLLLFSIFLLIHQENNTVNKLEFSENKHAKALLVKLNDVDDQLKILIAHSPDSVDYKTALASIQSDIKKSREEAAKDADIKKVAMQIVSMKDDIDSQLLDLKRTVASSQDAKQYLDKKALPFHVISIDVIAQQPFVSVDYANHIAPFTIGDSIAGWQITLADYATAQVEFKNEHDQYVKVSL